MVYIGHMYADINTPMDKFAYTVNVLKGLSGPRKIYIPYNENIILGG